MIFFNVESVIQITPITVRMTSTKKKDRKFNVTRGKSSNWILRLSGGIQTMGLKNDIKFKILQELMQETNIERPISIWKLRDAVYGEISVEGDKEKKKNKRDNQIRTVKKDGFELEAEGIVTITEMDEDGKIDNKKNII